MKLSVIYVLVPCDTHTIDESYINNNSNHNNNALRCVTPVVLI